MSTSLMCTVSSTCLSARPWSLPSHQTWSHDWFTTGLSLCIPMETIPVTPCRATSTTRSLCSTSRTSPIRAGPCKHLTGSITAPPAGNVNVYEMDFNEIVLDIEIVHAVSLSYFRYRDFRYPPGHHRQYEYSIYYWHVIAAKMAFIIVVEVSRNFSETLLWPDFSFYCIV